MATTINAGRVRFVSRGTYNNSTQYYLFDLVDYNGSSYIAKENTLGNLPTNTQYWQLIAEKGNTGSTGQTGPVGPTGNGISSIRKTGTDGLVDTYTITYTNGNTTTFTITNGEDGEVTETELDVLRQNDTELKNDISKNADEITNLKNENAYLQNVVKQAFTETSASGTELTINNTIEARMEMKLNGNTSQNGEPTPATPQEIHCVKGNNVVKVTNQNLSDESEEYPINLGSLELCKIGDYQDYIYKSNDKWYKHNEITKNTLLKVYNINEVWDNKNTNVCHPTMNINIKQGNYPFYSNKFMCYHEDKRNLNSEEIQNHTSNNSICIQISYSRLGDITYQSTTADKLTAINNWLANNNVEIYYILATPIEEEITDTTLITQLDEISQALSKKGTTIISQRNDDLPFNLDVIALTK